MNRRRAHVRHSDHVRKALEDTLVAHFSEHGKLDPEWWHEGYESEDEAKAMYERYLAERQINRRN